MAPPRNLLVVIGAGGIGLAAARRLGSGRDIVLADFSSQILDASRSALEAEGHQVSTALHVDVVDPQSVASLVEVITKTEQHVGAVIHTAGLSSVMGDAKKVLEVNLLGTANVLDAFLPIVEQGTAVVCLASVLGHYAKLSAELERHLATAPVGKMFEHAEIDLNSMDSNAAYRVSKRGNQLRVQAKASAYAEKGARLNSVSPGVVATAMNRAGHGDGTHSAKLKDLVERTPAGRIATPDDVADVIAFLAGEGSRYVIGTDLLVDGGLLANEQWGDNA